MTQERIKCPFCAQSRLLYSDNYEGGVFRWGDITKIPPSQFPLIEIREESAGPGRGHREKGVGGFPLVETYSMLEMLESPEYADYAEYIRQRMLDLIRDWVASGIIDVSEFI